MAKANETILSFNGGEVDDPTLARAEIEGYKSRAGLMENIFPYVQGKMSKAPGSKFLDEITALAELLDEAGEALLDEAGNVLLSEGESLGIVRPFVRSGESAYVLELSAGQIRFIDNSTEEYIMIDGANATIGSWSDQSAAPPSGGGDPIEPGYSDVVDPFYVDIDYNWIVTTEGGGALAP
jgi:hypothetical protein